MFHGLCVLAIMPAAVSSPAECMLSLPHVLNVMKNMLNGLCDVL